MEHKVSVEGSSRHRESERARVEDPVTEIVASIADHDRLGMTRNTDHEREIERPRLAGTEGRMATCHVDAHDVGVAQVDRSSRCDVARPDTEDETPCEESAPHAGRKSKRRTFAPYPRDASKEALEWGKSPRKGGETT
jgi:hypothetical protein